MSKGSKRRPSSVSRTEYEANFERVFPPKRGPAPPAPRPTRKP